MIADVVLVTTRLPLRSYAVMPIPHGRGRERQKREEEKKKEKKKWDEKKESQ